MWVPLCAQVRIVRSVCVVQFEYNFFSKSLEFQGQSQVKITRQHHHQFRPKSVTEAHFHYPQSFRVGPLTGPAHNRQYITDGSMASWLSNFISSSASKKSSPNQPPSSPRALSDGFPEINGPTPTPVRATAAR